MRSVPIPNRGDIEIAGAFVRQHLRPTPLLESTWLEGVQLKLESMQPTGSFKVRGALVALSQLDAGRGVVTSSAGNHGLGIAFAAERLGREATIVVPEGASKAKVDALGRFRARIVQRGSTYDEAEAHAMSLALEGNVDYVSPYNDRWVVAGQGTIGLELAVDLQEQITVVCPIGGGGLCSGIALWASGFPNVRVIGVDCESSPAMRAAIDAGQIVEVPVRASLADGLSGNLESGSITFKLVNEFVENVAVVSEQEVEEAVRFLALQQGLVTEGAGAAATAALLAGQIETRGRTIVLVTGRNIARAVFARLLADPTGA